MILLKGKIPLVSFIFNTTAEMKLAILVFLYRGEFVMLRYDFYSKSYNF